MADGLNSCIVFRGEQLDMVAEVSGILELNKFSASKGISEFCGACFDDLKFEGFKFEVTSKHKSLIRKLFIAAQ